MATFKGHVSHRASIRWLPNAASEPTSTLVLTSSAGWFIDIRILLQRTSVPHELGIGDDELLRPSSKNGQTISGSKQTPIHFPAERIDWAFFGTSKSTTMPDGKRHSEWTHWVDSKTLFHQEPIVDAGDMFPLTQSRDLEKGSMVNPDTGVDTEYEEVWDDMVVDVARLDSGESATCLVLLTEDVVRETKGCVMKLGCWVQGVLRVGGDVYAERWMFVDEEKRWVLVARVGDISIGCEIAFETDESMEVGKVVEAEGRKWSVKEIDWSPPS